MKRTQAIFPQNHSTIHLCIRAGFIPFFSSRGRWGINRAARPGPPYSPTGGLRRDRQETPAPARSADEIGMKHYLYAKERIYAKIHAQITPFSAHYRPMDTCPDCYAGICKDYTSRKAGNNPRSISMAGRSHGRKWQALAYGQQHSIVYYAI